MTQNLRLSSTTEDGSSRVLTPEDSNVTSNWSFPTNSLTSGNSFAEARSTISSNTSYGGYYNYCAASAGTVCSQTQQDATQDICPKGWRLPTHDEQNGIINYTSAFSPIYSGFYFNTALNNVGSHGYWWSATANTSSYQYILYYYNGSLDVSGGSKGYGYSIRVTVTPSAASTPAPSPSTSMVTVPQVVV